MFRRRGVAVRSIPAHAGEPAQPMLSLLRITVYPRPRGGTKSRPRCAPSLWGLSPPTRGNRLVFAPLPLSWGSIPAHAGEPRVVSPSVIGSKVYPRPRGGTRLLGESRRTGGGLSPPTRGNQSASCCEGSRERSIPAHAGEPALSPLAGHRDGVYPRPRGGTFDGRPDSETTTGLSPPTRGNHRVQLCGGVHRWSIPAHAGEP